MMRQYQNSSANARVQVRKINEMLLKQRLILYAERLVFCECYFYTDNKIKINNNHAYRIEEIDFSLCFNTNKNNFIQNLAIEIESSKMKQSLKRIIVREKLQKISDIDNHFDFSFSIEEKRCEVQE